MDQPLGVDELAALLAAIGGFEPRPLIAVAVSGGPDSLALTILADRWARGCGGVAWGIIIDHRLRPESGAEACRVGAWLAARGIPHAILAWDGDKPAAGIQEAAREARYRLLGEWCRAQGCLHLLTAHHREDQAETYLIRRRAKSGSDGLAAMAAVRELPGYRLVRPLLAVPRARLAAFLAAEGQDFISDPSNRDRKFERVRVRENLEPAIDAILAEAQHHGIDRIEREQALDRLMARTVAVHPAGFAVLDPAGFDEALLGRVAMTIGGGVYPPRRERLARLCDGLRAAPLRARTLGGCRFVPWRGRILVVRELAAAAAPAWLGPGAGLVWDRRFRVSLPAEAPVGLILSCLGPAGVAGLGRASREAARLPAPVFPVLPAFRDSGGRVVGVPHLGYRDPAAAAPPSLRFSPVAPLSRAAFTVV